MSQNPLLPERRPDGNLVRRLEKSLGALHNIQLEASAGYWYRRGIERKEHEDWEGASYCFGRELLLNSDHWQAWLQNSYTFARLNQEERCRQHLLQAEQHRYAHPTNTFADELTADERRYMRQYLLMQAQSMMAGFFDGIIQHSCFYGQRLCDRIEMLFNSLDRNAGLLLDKLLPLAIAVWYDTTLIYQYDARPDNKNENQAVEQICSVLDEMLDMLNTTYYSAEKAGPVEALPIDNSKYKFFFFLILGRLFEKYNWDPKGYIGPGRGYTGAIKLAPEDPVAHYVYGLYAAKDPIKFRIGFISEMLDKAFALNRNYWHDEMFNYASGIGKIFVRYGDDVPPVESLGNRKYTLRKVIDFSYRDAPDISGAQQCFERAVALNETSTRGYYQLAKIAMWYTGEYIVARHCFARTAVLNSQDELRAYHQGDIVYYQGLAEHALENYQQAIAYYDAAFPHYGQHHMEIYLHRAEAKLAVKKYTSAIEDFNNVLVGDGYSYGNPGNVRALNGRAAARRALNDIAGAEADEIKVLEIKEQWRARLSGR